MSHLYLPFIEKPQLIVLGNKALKTADWIEPDDNFDTYHQNKLSQHQQNPQQVYVATEGASEAITELSERLLTHLTHDHADIYQLNEKQQLLHHNLTHTTQKKNCLWNTSLWVQEDLCILQKSSHEYHLTAASLCAPSDWNLLDKIGQPLSLIHAPVPELNTRLGRSIQHVLDTLSPLRPFQRFNWSLKDTDQLALFPNNTSAASIDIKNPSLFLRVERQTLTRLPTTNAIAFTLRIYIHPLEELANTPGAIEKLKHAIDSMSAEEARYKSIEKMYPQFRRFCKTMSKQAQ